MSNYNTPLPKTGYSTSSGVKFYDTTTHDSGSVNNNWISAASRKSLSIDQIIIDLEEKMGLLSGSNNSSTLPFTTSPLVFFKKNLKELSKITYYMDSLLFEIENAVVESKNEVCFSKNDTRSLTKINEDQTMLNIITSKLSYINDINIPSTRFTFFPKEVCESVIPRLKTLITISKYLNSNKTGDNKIGEGLLLEEVNDFIEK